MIFVRNFLKPSLVIGRQSTMIKKANFSFGETNLDLKRRKQAQLAKKLRQSLSPSFLQVIDTSVGSNTCGQMYRILIESPIFEGKSRVQQHQMVAEVIKEDMKYIHGFSLKTKVTESEKKNSHKDLQTDHNSEELTHKKQ